MMQSTLMTTNNLIHKRC